MIYNRPAAFPGGGVRVGVGGGGGGMMGGVILPQSYRRLSPGRSRDSSADSEEEMEGSTRWDQLHSIRRKLEHNKIGRSSVNKRDIFTRLSDIVQDDDPEIQQTALLLIQDILPHLGPDTDACMSQLIEALMPQLGSDNISHRKTTVHILQIYLKFSSDVQSVLRNIVLYGLESSNKSVVHETLISVPILFPPDFDTRYGSKNLYILVSGLARKLTEEDYRVTAFLAINKIADVVGIKTFNSYLSKLSNEQKKVWEDLSQTRARFESEGNGVVGKKVSRGWVEFGAIDHQIIEKLQNEEDSKIKLQGAEELNRCLKNMKDMNGLTPQLRLFFTFLDSLLDENNFKMSLLVLDMYTTVIDRLKGKVKPHLRGLVSSLLKHTGDSKMVVRVENYRVFERLLHAVKPNTVINQLLDHLGDKRAATREGILNMIMFGLLTFPSNEFDLKNVAATVVPTLVDPKRRVRQASLECVAILAAFLGPSKAVPLMRAIELLESHFEKGTGVLNAVQARLARRQLAKLTQDGLVEYALQIPSAARSPGRSGDRWGSDIEWILAGSGSISSGSAGSSNIRTDSRLDDSSTSLSPGSPVHVNGTQVRRPWSKSKSASQDSSKSSVSRRSRSEENVSGSPSPRGTARSNTESEIKYRGFSILPSKIPASTLSQRQSAWSSRNGTAKSKPSQNGTLPNLEGSSIGNHRSREPQRKDFNGVRKITPDSELPRLIGTKSQASTASSSATRDSGISLNDLDAAEARGRGPTAQQHTGFQRSRSKTNMISVDTLPVHGQPVNLMRRDSVDGEVVGPGRKWKARPGDPLSDPEDDVVISAIDMNGESPRTPKYFPGEAPLQPKTSLLLRPVENSPFSSALRRGLTGSSDNISTPYSQISGISSYDYEDDFTSDEESQYSALTSASRKSTSKIPIKRSSSLHRRTNLLLKGSAGNLSDKSAAVVPPTPNYVPEINQISVSRSKTPSPDEENIPSREKAELKDEAVQEKPADQNKPRMSRSSVSNQSNRSRLSPHTANKGKKGTARTKSVSPQVQTRLKSDFSSPALTPAKSTSDLPSSPQHLEDELPDVPPKLPKTEPPKRRMYNQSTSVPGSSRRTQSSTSSQPRRSTAGSSSSLSSSQNLPLLTVPSLKSPFDGVRIAAWAKPEDGLQRTIEQLEADDWEKNVDGLTGLLRLIHHNPETVIVEYKQLIHLVLKQVKNLRSQVARAAAFVVGDMFTYLKRNMESDMEKVVLPLLHKTGDTNKFLREDCNCALDRMVENISPARSIAILTGEILHHKSPVIRTTTSRLLALTTDKIGAARALAGTKDITEKLLPAVAKMAQDGSLEARIYAKMTLKCLMEHADFERILKKNVTPNTMRNLEKILDQVRGLGSNAGSRLNSRGARSSRKTL